MNYQEYESHIIKKVVPELVALRSVGGSRKTGLRVSWGSIFKAKRCSAQYLFSQAFSGRDDRLPNDVPLGGMVAQKVLEDLHKSCGVELYTDPQVRDQLLQSDSMRIRKMVISRLRVMTHAVYGKIRFPEHDILSLVEKKDLKEELLENIYDQVRGALETFEVFEVDNGNRVLCEEKVYVNLRGSLIRLGGSLDYSVARSDRIDVYDVKGSRRVDQDHEQVLYYLVLKSIAHVLEYPRTPRVFRGGYLYSKLREYVSVVEHTDSDAYEKLAEFANKLVDYVSAHVGVIDTYCKELTTPMGKKPGISSHNMAVFRRKLSSPPQYSPSYNACRYCEFRRHCPQSPVIPL